jgi:DNA repair exonuclease SbcCD nuclease subunit
VILATGDWHISNYPQFARPWREGLNSRVRDIADCLLLIPGIIRKHKVKVFCHLGDWHQNSSNDYRLINLTRQIVEKCADAIAENNGVMIGIHGNHDTSSSNPTSHNNYPYIPMSGDTVIEHDGILFYLLGFNSPIPEPSKLDQRAKFSVFLIHKDIVGAETSKGFVYKTDSPLGVSYFMAVRKMLKNQVVFLAGHYHKPQMAAGYATIVGAPVQHNRGDMGSQRGIVLFDEKTKTVQKQMLNGPAFHELIWPMNGSQNCGCGRRHEYDKERDYLTVTVKSAGTEWSEARDWVKHSGLNAAVSIKPEEDRKSDAAPRAGMSILNEEELLKKYLLEREKLHPIEAATIMKLANEA